MKSLKLMMAISLLLSVCITDAQSIPNSGFENWTTANGYSAPDSWGNLNSKTSTASVYTCTKGTPGSPGSSYLKLISKNVSGMGVQPGIAVSGVLNPTNLTYDSGFAFSQRPTSLTGKWQYMAYGSDAGYIKVYLTKFNATTQAHDVVGSIVKNLSGMVMSWANFDLPITYNSTDIPDSCTIVLSASGSTPVANSYLYIDNLSFTYPLGVEDFSKTGSFSFYPNPANDMVNVDLSSLESKAESVTIFDIDGKELLAKKDIGDNEMVTLTTANLSNGMYFLTINTQNGNVTQKFIKK